MDFSKVAKPHILHKNETSEMVGIFQRYPEGVF